MTGKSVPVAVVTGANRGIGLEFAKAYKKLGYFVVATSRKVEDEKLKGLGIDKVLPLDISQDQSISEFSRLVKGIPLPGPISVLINNAGIFLKDQYETVEGTGVSISNRSALVEQFSVNCCGALLVTQSLWNHLNGDTKVINITSRMGSIADNTSGGHYGYRASKAALNAVTKSLSFDLKRDGKGAVLALHPGYIQTDMTNGNGEMAPDEAVQRMIKVIDDFKADQSGEFRHRDGPILPY